jgi:hypothetical protein
MHGEKFEQKSRTDGDKKKDGDASTYQFSVYIQQKIDNTCTDRCTKTKSTTLIKFCN